MSGALNCSSDASLALPGSSKVSSNLAKLGESPKHTKNSAETQHYNIPFTFSSDVNTPLTFHPGSVQEPSPYLFEHEPLPSSSSPAPGVMPYLPSHHHQHLPHPHYTGDGMPHFAASPYFNNYLPGSSLPSSGAMHTSPSRDHPSLTPPATNPQAIATSAMLASLLLGDTSNYSQPGNVPLMPSNPLSEEAHRNMMLQMSHLLYLRQMQHMYLLQSQVAHHAAAGLDACFNLPYPSGPGGLHIMGGGPSVNGGPMRHHDYHKQRAQLPHHPIMVPGSDSYDHEANGSPRNKPQETNITSNRK